MDLHLFYDNETSGLPLWGQPSEHPEQPHIVQIAALLVDLDTCRTVAGIDLIVKPDGWRISEETTAIHGITNEYAEAVGVPEEVAINALLSLWQGRPRVAHSESFDARIVRIALKRFGQDELADQWKDSVAICTGQMSREFCKLPKNKMPKLAEAYMHFFGVELRCAHSAMADASACRDIFFAMRSKAPQPIREQATQAESAGTASPLVLPELPENAFNA